MSTRRRGTTASSESKLPVEKLSLATLQAVLRDIGPLPVEQLKAETFRSMCRELGAPRLAKIDVMAPFVEDVCRDGLKYALERLASGAPRTSNSRSEAVSDDEPQPSAPAQRTTTRKRPNTGVAPPEDAEDAAADSETDAHRAKRPRRAATAGPSGASVSVVLSRRVNRGAAALPDVSESISTSPVRRAAQRGRAGPTTASDDAPAEAPARSTRARGPPDVPAMAEESASTAPSRATRARTHAAEAPEPVKVGPPKRARGRPRGAKGKTQPAPVAATNTRASAVRGTDALNDDAEYEDIDEGDEAEEEPKVETIVDSPSRRTRARATVADEDAAPTDSPSRGTRSRQVVAKGAGPAKRGRPRKVAAAALFDGSASGDEKQDSPPPTKRRRNKSKRAEESDAIDGAVLRPHSRSAGGKTRGTGRRGRPAAKHSKENEEDEEEPDARKPEAEQDEDEEQKLARPRPPWARLAHVSVYSLKELRKVQAREREKAVDGGKSKGKPRSRLFGPYAVDEDEDADAEGEIDEEEQAEGGWNGIVVQPGPNGFIAPAYGLSNGAAVSAPASPHPAPLSAAGAPDIFADIDLSVHDDVDDALAIDLAAQAEPLLGPVAPADPSGDGSATSTDPLDVIGDADADIAANADLLGAGLGTSIPAALQGGQVDPAVDIEVEPSVSVEPPPAPGSPRSEPDPLVHAASADISEGEVVVAPGEGEEVVIKTTTTTVEVVEEVFERVSPAADVVSMGSPADAASVGDGAATSTSAMAMVVDYNDEEEEEEAPAGVPLAGPDPREDSVVPDDPNDEDDLVARGHAPPVGGPLASPPLSKANSPLVEAPMTPPLRKPVDGLRTPTPMRALLSVPPTPAPVHVADNGIAGGL